MSDYDVSTNVWAEINYLRLLLEQKGLPRESAERALDNYEMSRRLSDEHERCLLIDYGYANLATDIYSKVPLGDQWSKYEGTLFNVKERALSRSRYHILTQAYRQRQQETKKQKDPYD